MSISPSIRIPLCIEKGSVFNFYIGFNDLRRDSKNRYFVVLNNNPKSDIVLVMLTPTTKIEKTKNLVKNWKISQKTIVEINLGDYRIFTKKCVFDCNSVYEIDTEKLINKIEKNGSMNYPKMSETIIRRLVIGIKKSPRVTSEIKKLL